MKEMEVQLEKLLIEASECSLIAKLATNRNKRELFTKLAEHYTILAAEVRKAMGAPQPSSLANGFTSKRSSNTCTAIDDEIARGESGTRNRH
jgi:hypothetical protein